MYSEEFRNKVMEYYYSTKSIKLTSKRFNVCDNTIYTWKKEDKGLITKSNKRRKVNLVDLNEFREISVSNNDKKVVEPSLIEFSLNGYMIKISITNLCLLLKELIKWSIYLT